MIDWHQQNTVRAGRLTYAFSFDFKNIINKTDLVVVIMDLLNNLIVYSSFCTTNKNKISLVNH